MGRLDGIDVSQYQGLPNWQQVLGQLQQRWVAIRTYAAHAGHVDTSFNHNRAQAASARCRLLYWWLLPGTPAANQVETFFRVIGNLQDGEGVMLDAEESGITADLCADWCDRVEQRTQRPVAVYTGGYVAGGSIWHSSKLFNGQRARVFAAYSTESEARNRHAAGIPWDAWQYSSTGHLVGITGNVDLDQVDNMAIFDRACHAAAPPPPPDLPPPPYDPWHHQYSLWPLAAKPSLRWGDGYAPGTEANRPACTYFNHVAIFEAGGGSGYLEPYWVFTNDGNLNRGSSVRTVRNLNAFFNRNGANTLLAQEAWNGVAGPETWRIIDFLASRQR